MRGKEVICNGTKLETVAETTEKTNAEITVLRDSMQFSFSTRSTKEARILRRHKEKIIGLLLEEGVCDASVATFFGTVHR